MPLNKTLTIGLQVNSLSDAYNAELIDCINATACKLGVNLILLVGGHPEKVNYTRAHHQSVIYQHINARNLDAIIVLSAALGSYITKDTFENILRDFISIPIISIGCDISSFIDNQSSIVINAKSGFAQLIEHLITTHHLTKLAFITGPLTNKEAQERFDTYKEVLNKHNLPVQEQWIYYGEFLRTDAQPALNQLLNNHTMPEAIICSNDDCALGVIEELSKRNIRVPEQIVVTGFDNIKGARTSSPSLSTVSQIFLKISELAMSLAIAKANKSPCNPLYELNTVAINRESCGCHQTQKKALHNPFTSLNALELKQPNDTNEFSILEKIRTTVIINSLSNIDKCLVNFEEYYLNDLKKLIAFDIRIQSGFQRWLNAIEKFEHTYEDSTDEGQATKLIAIRIRDTLNKEFTVIRDSMLSSRDNIFFIKDILEEISDCTSFEQLSIKVNNKYQQLKDYINLDNYVVLGYPEPVKHDNKRKWVAPKTILPLLSINNNIKNTQYDSSILIPKALLPKKERFTLVVETLYSADNQLGRVAFELYDSELDLFSCSMITANIASTILIIHQNNERKIANDKIELLVSDLAHKKQLAEKAVVAKGRFLATMSHEIRTPMNGVLGITELLQTSKLDKSQRNYLNIIQSSSHSLLNIISDILDFSKIEEGKLEIEEIDFNLKELCNEVISIFKFNENKKDISLLLKLDSKLPLHIQSDPTRLRQILINLIGNAFKFTQTGSISLKVSLINEKDDHIKLKFSIIDTGIGISKSNLNALFEAFNQADTSTTRKYGGTGLGLSISKSLTELMGGEIGVTSEVNVGSTFWFNIRCKNKKTKSINASASINSSTQTNLLQHNEFKGKRILVAEDNSVNQLVIKGMLKKFGCKVTIANDGQAAIDLFNTSKQPFDLIIMDYEMPVLDGCSATEIIREIEANQNVSYRAHIPIIAITAHAMNEHRQLCLAAGMNDHLSKPIEVKQLYLTLKKHL